MKNQAAHHDNSQVMKVLDGLTKLWNDRATVLSGDPSVELAFYPEKEDFKEKLLPFHQHAAWQNADEDIKQKILSYGWIIYNEKTIQIESKLIAPVCDLLIDSEYPGSRSDEIQNSISQALVDESFHTLMAVKSINIVYRERGLKRVKLPTFQLIRQLELMLAGCKHDEDKKLVRLAVACASETLITDYLGLLSKDEKLQPLCYKTVEAHAADEWSHASVFSYTMAEIFQQLTSRQQTLYLNTLPKAVKAFGDNELDIWETVLSEIDFPDYQTMIMDCRIKEKQNISVDVKGISKLLSSLGIDEGNLKLVA